MVRGLEADNSERQTLFHCPNSDPCLTHIKAMEEPGVSQFPAAGGVQTLPNQVSNDTEARKLPDFLKVSKAVSSGVMRKAHCQSGQ